MTEFFFLVKPDNSKVLCLRCSCGRNQAVSGATVVCGGCGITHTVPTDTNTLAVKQPGMSKKDFGL